MRTGYGLSFVIIAGLLGLNFATADRPIESRDAGEPTAAASTAAFEMSPVICPLWPIWDYGNETYMFYSERYDWDSECTNPMAGWWIGYAPDWPYFCPDCLLSSFRAGREPAKNFEGLEAKVPVDFRPEFPAAPGADKGVSFLGEEFVEFTVPETKKVHRVKLLRIRINAAAAGRTQGRERVIGLGYEVEEVPQLKFASLPASEGEVTAVNGSQRGYRVNVGSQQYLVLLAR